MDTLSFEPIVAKGFKVFFETDWVGEVGVDRHEVKTDRIRGFHLELSPLEWCAMCMNEGSHYVGGCCGNMSAAQDIISSAFREGGYIAAGDFRELGDLSENHESGEDYLFKGRKGYIGGTFAIKTQKDFDKVLAKWDDIGPLGKIGLLYATVRDRLKLPSDAQPVVHHEGREPLSPEIAFTTLERTCRFLSYADLFIQPPEESTQHGIDRMMTLARLLPAARAVLKLIEQQLQPTEGYAIVKADAPEDVVRNGYGLCMYRGRDEADKLIMQWAQDKPDMAKLLTIRPVKITAEEGLVFPG